jgi:glycine/D-amino acid oxidase-like deaminating enzyme
VSSVDYSGKISHPYAARTPRGTVTSRHLIHCTNGYAAHLLPALRGKIVPVRGQMTVQKPHSSFIREGEKRSWSLLYANGAFDYMTQSPSPEGFIYLGGGLGQALKEGVNDLGCSDDSELNRPALEHLSKVVSQYFEGGQDTQVTHQWTGIMGYTPDLLPIVGRVPADISATVIESTEVKRSEWIAAGFCGHGMVYTWLSGKGIAQMLLGGDDAVGADFPWQQFACTKQRLDLFNTKAIKRWFN